jgi:hypothetical protein
MRYFFEAPASASANSPKASKLRMDGSGVATEVTVKTPVPPATREKTGGVAFGESEKSVTHVTVAQRSKRGSPNNGATGAATEETDENISISSPAGSSNAKKFPAPAPKWPGPEKLAVNEPRAPDPLARKFE